MSDSVVLQYADGGRDDAFKTCVNAWTQWGRLNAVVVGRVPQDARYPAEEPNFVGAANDGTQFPAGEPVPKRDIDLANAELDNLASVLAAEQVHVAKGRGELQKTKHDGLEVDKVVTTPGRGRAPANGKGQQAPQDEGGTMDATAKAGVQQQQETWTLEHKPSDVSVYRPAVMPHDTALSTPIWQLPHQSGNACPRDVMITIGKNILESSNSRRSRAAEWQQYRPLVNRLRQSDPLMRHRVGPEPLRADTSYDQTFFQQTDQERLRRMHHYTFALREDEVFFDAADISRVGKDLFVQLSMTTNRAGIDWLRREFEPEGMRVNTVHFPYDLHPSHIDCTFVPLRPPRGLFGTQGLAMYNPDRPPLAAEMALWHNNNWRLIPAAEPTISERPVYSQSSRWLSMNLLALSDRCVVVEECEINLHDQLTDLGFDVITVPFRNFYQFGGGLHCATWDVERDDACVDYFPDQENNPRRNRDHFFLEDVLHESGFSHPYTARRATAARADQVRTRDTSANGNRDTAGSGSEDTSDDDNDDNDGNGNNGTNNGEEMSGGSSMTSLSSKEARSSVAVNLRGNTELQDGHSLVVDDVVLAHHWEAPYLEALADQAASHGGVLLEVGWGLGIAGRRVQNHYGDVVREHHVIEGNPEVFAQLQEYARERNEAREQETDTEGSDQASSGGAKIVPHFGDWRAVAPKLVEKYGAGYFTSILYDACPPDEDSLHGHVFEFAEASVNLLDRGGCLVFCDLASVGQLMAERASEGQADSHEDSDPLSQVFREHHRPRLMEAGFRNVAIPKRFTFTQRMLAARSDAPCGYYTHSEAMVPCVIKY